MAGTFSMSDLYPLSPEVAPAAPPGPTVAASGGAASAGTAPAMALVGIVVALVLVRLLWENAK